MFAKIFTVSALALAVAAAPSMSYAPSSSKLLTDAQTECGNNATISCCNSNQGDSVGGLLTGFLDGLNCIQVPVLAVPVLDHCSGSNVAACCPGGGDDSPAIGLDLSCSPITL